MPHLKTKWNVIFSTIPVISSLFGPHFQLSTLFSNTLSLSFSLGVREKFRTVASQISQTANTTLANGISLVVVYTGDRIVGLSTLITKVTVSLSMCLLELIRYASLICPKTTITSTALLNLSQYPISCVSRLQITLASQHVSLELSLEGFRNICAFPLIKQKILPFFFCRGLPIVLQNWKTTIYLFQPKETIFY